MFFFSWVFLSCLVGVQTNWKGSTFEGSAKSVVFLLESSLDGWLVTNVENEVLEMLDLSSVIETISIPCKCIWINQHAKNVPSHMFFYLSFTLLSQINHYIPVKLEASMPHCWSTTPLLILEVFFCLMEVSSLRVETRQSVDFCFLHIITSSKVLV